MSALKTRKDFFIANTWLTKDDLSGIIRMDINFINANAQMLDR